MNTNRRPYTLADWSAANQRLNALHDLYATADNLGLEDWAERIDREAAEMQHEVDTIFTDLAARGIEP